MLISRFKHLLKKHKQTKKQPKTHSVMAEVKGMEAVSSCVTIFRKHGSSSFQNTETFFIEQVGVSSWRPWLSLALWMPLEKSIYIWSLQIKSLLSLNFLCSVPLFRSLASQDWLWSCASRVLMPGTMLPRLDIPWGTKYIWSHWNLGSNLRSTTYWLCGLGKLCNPSNPSSSSELFVT